jgi:hypothetical protein
VPAGPRSGFRSHDMRLGPHSHSASAKWPIHKADLDLNRRPWLNPLGAQKEDSAGTDIRRSQSFAHTLRLPGDAPHAQRKAELRSSVRAPFFWRANGMGGNALDALRLGSRGPQRRVSNRSARTGRQFFNGGIAAAGIGLVHEFLRSSCAHKSPLDSYASGTARGHYPPRSLTTSIWVPSSVVLMHTPRRTCFCRHSNH